MTIDQGIAAAAAVGQMAAAFLALAALLLTVRTARAQAQMSDRIAREQAALMFEQARLQRDSDILRWTERCIETLSEADAFVGALSSLPMSEIDKLQHGALLTRLSALIDQGRMYFPNQTPEKQGTGKPVAYQGFRQRILTVLVRSYDEIAKAASMKSPNDAKNGMERLLVLRRMFVSEAQIAIDPRRFIALKEMNELRACRGIAADQPTVPEGEGGGIGVSTAEIKMPAPARAAASG
jgi:hypothetical protein